MVKATILYYEHIEILFWEHRSNISCKENKLEIRKVRRLRLFKNLFKSCTTCFLKVQITSVAQQRRKKKLVLFLNANKVNHFCSWRFNKADRLEEKEMTPTRRCTSATPALWWSCLASGGSQSPAGAETHLSGKYTCICICYLPWTRAERFTNERNTNTMKYNRRFIM